MGGIMRNGNKYKLIDYIYYNLILSIRRNKGVK